MMLRSEQADRTRSIAIIEAVAAAEGVDPADLDLVSLYDSVDPDAVNRIGNATLELDFHGYYVTSHPDGTVDLEKME